MIQARLRLQQDLLLTCGFWKTLNESIRELFKDTAGRLSQTRSLLAHQFHSRLSAKT